jgi:hypothetical protein
MLNMQDLVGTLMQGVLAGSSQGRIAHALSGRGLSRPGGYSSRYWVVRQMAPALAPAVSSMSWRRWPGRCLAVPGREAGVAIRSPLVDWALLLSLW